jgi:hypothetical protein
MADVVAVDESGESSTKVVEGQERRPLVKAPAAATAGAVEVAGQLGQQQALDAL